MHEASYLRRLGWFIAGSVFALYFSPLSNVVSPESSFALDNKPSSHVSNLICRSFPKPNVAFCISGLVRSLNDPVVHQTLRANLIDAFGGNPYVFLSLRPNRPISQNSSELDISDAIETLRPEKVVWRPFDALIPPISCEYQKGSHFAGNDRNPRQSAAQYRGIQECYELVQEYESKVGKGFFSWVFKVRTDAVYLQPIMPHCLYIPDRVYAHRTDFLNWVPRRFADIWFNALDFMYSCNSSVKYGNAETFLKTFAETEKIVFEDHFMLPVIPKRKVAAEGHQFCHDWRYRMDTRLCMGSVYGLESPTV